MTVVKELNELAYKMTGKNPRAKTDQQALNYIEQNYKGGDTPSPSNIKNYFIDFDNFYLWSESTSYRGDITDSEIVGQLNEIANNIKNGEIADVYIKYNTGSSEIYAHTVRVEYYSGTVYLVFVVTFDICYGNWIGINEDGTCEYGVWNQ